MGCNKWERKERERERFLKIFLRKQNFLSNGME